MTTVTFINVRNTRSLFDLIDNCKKPVYLKSERKIEIDLRGNEEIKKLLTMACSNNCVEKMSVVISSQSDMPDVINYLMSNK